MAAAQWGNLTIVATGGAGDDTGGVENGGALFVNWARQGEVASAGWTHADKIVPTDVMADALVGSSVAVSATAPCVAVGASGWSAGGVTAGAVLIYGPSSKTMSPAGAWVRHAVLTPDSALGGGARFGAAIAMDGTRVLVAAPYAPGGGQAFVSARATGTLLQPCHRGCPREAACSRTRLQVHKAA